MPEAPARSRRTETLAPEPVESLAGVLDIDPPTGGTVPPLWHWTYLLDRRPQRDLGPDGHPGHGIPAPPGPGRRRLFAGGRVRTHELLRLGEPATRTAWVSATRDVRGRSGPLTFVTVRLEVEQAGRLAVAEEQDIVYLAPRDHPATPAGPAAPAAAGPTTTPPPRAAARQGPVLDLQVTPTLLFRFSALTYNAHRIHYDQEFARAQGHADLVVHGPLQALLMGELLRRHGVPLVGREWCYRLVSPVTGPQRLRAQAGPDGLEQGAEIRSGAGELTAASSLA